MGKTAIMLHHGLFGSPEQAGRLIVLPGLSAYAEVDQIREEQTMHRSTVMSLCWAVITIVWLTACSQNTPAPSADDQLDQLIDDYLAHYLTSHPHEASRLGLSDYHGQLPDLSVAGLTAEAATLTDFQERLAVIDEAELTTRDHQVDYDLLSRLLAVRLFELETFPRWQREPRQYLPFRALSQLVTDPHLSDTERVDYLLQRLTALPDLLAAGKENLTNPPERFVTDAMDSAQTQLPYFTDVIPALAAEHANPEPLTAASAAAAQAVEAWLEFLEHELLPRATGDIGVGETAYQFYLEQLHGLAETPDELAARGQAYFDQAKQELEAQARAIDPDRSWQEITADIRDRHPTRDGLLAAYCDEIERARDHVKQADLAYVPDQEEVRCIPSEPDQRAFSPFGTFSVPAPFADTKIGYLILHPVPEGLPEEEAESLLRAHDDSWTQVIAAHEAYPGHHLQALHAQENPRPLRNIYSTPVFTEGWGLYTEELMYETGFFERPEKTRLTQLRLRLWRAARVVLDSAIHRGEMTIPEAREFLAEQTGMEHSATAGEVGIYLYRPSYAIGYIVGYHEVMALREDYFAAYPDHSLREFHDTLLGVGSIPFPLVRQQLAL